jgi:hypothetical protein
MRINVRRAANFTKSVKTRRHGTVTASSTTVGARSRSASRRRGACMRRCSKKDTPNCWRDIELFKIHPRPGTASLQPHFRTYVPRRQSARTIRNLAMTENVFAPRGVQCDIRSYVGDLPYRRFVRALSVLLIGLSAARSRSTHSQGASVGPCAGL